jgi:ubiquinone/menaquinone biosynthesis C-methylase UbiE
MSKQGLRLDRVVLLGRTFDEYCRYFLLEPAALAGKRVLDVAGGVSSFTAEATARGIGSISFDPVYAWPLEKIEARTGPDLESIFKDIQGLSTYRWSFYGTPERMRELRAQASRQFLADIRGHPEHYVPGELPRLPFADASFDLTLASYLLFVYEEQFSYEFHRDSLLEIMRVTKSEGEARIYPIVTFEAERSSYLSRLAADPQLTHLRFDEVKTDFEFLANSNSFLRITRR